MAILVPALNDGEHVLEDPAFEMASRSDDSKLPPIEHKHRKSIFLLS